MTTRYYSKTTSSASYASDGQGEVCEDFSKVFSVSAQIAAGSNIALPLLNPKGSKVQSFLVQIRTSAGALYVSHAINLTTYVLGADNVLTISVPANGTAIPQDATITVFFSVK